MFCCEYALNAVTEFFLPSCFGLGAALLPNPVGALPLDRSAGPAGGGARAPPPWRRPAPPPFRLSTNQKPLEGRPTLGGFSCLFLWPLDDGGGQEVEEEEEGGS